MWSKHGELITTVICAVFGLHGTELERPLAIVMIGGLVSSTLFTLLAPPTFYELVHNVGLRWQRRGARR